MKYCPECQYPNPDNLSSCFKCGTELEQKDEPTPCEEVQPATDAYNKAVDVCDQEQVEPLVECPFCKGDIAAGVQKCRHCGEWLDGQVRKHDQQRSIEDKVLRAIVWWLVGSAVGWILCHTIIGPLFFH